MKKRKRKKESKVAYWEARTAIHDAIHDARAATIAAEKLSEEVILLSQKANRAIALALAKTEDAERRVFAFEQKNNPAMGATRPTIHQKKTQRRR